MANAWDKRLEVVENGLTSTKRSNKVITGPTGLVEVQVEVTSASGTSPTLDVWVQESDDDISYVDIVGCPRFTDAGTKTFYFKTDKKYAAFNFLVGGTDPSFDVTIRVRGL